MVCIGLLYTLSGCSPLERMLCMRSRAIRRRSLRCARITDCTDGTDLHRFFIQKKIRRQFFLLSSVSICANLWHLCNLCLWHSAALDHGSTRRTPAIAGVREENSEVATYQIHANHARGYWIPQINTRFHRKPERIIPDYLKYICAICFNLWNRICAIRQNHQILLYLWNL
jgi:hypothetical protein